MCFKTITCHKDVAEEAFLAMLLNVLSSCCRLCVGQFPQIVYCKSTKENKRKAFRCKYIAVVIFKRVKLAL